MIWLALVSWLSFVAGWLSSSLYQDHFDRKSRGGTIDHTPRR